MHSNNLYFFACAIFFSPLLGKLVKKIYDFYKFGKESKNENLLFSLLQKITPKEFQILTSEYLSFLGFNNITMCPTLENYTSMTCINNSSNFYVTCKRKNEDSYITIEDIEELLGTIVSENFYNGIIVTTNKVSNEANEYLKTITFPYKIDIISLFK